MVLGPALLIFGASYLLMSVPRLPFIHRRLDRHFVAVAGGAAMVAFGVLAPSQAFAAIDVDILVLLFGMMAIVAGLEAAGFFNYAAAKMVERATTQQALLLYTCLFTALLSALILNDAVVLLFTPVLVKACREMGVSAMPYLAAEAISANIGSVATEVGNPQNALIALQSGIGFLDYSARLAPVAAVCLVVAWLMLRIAFGRELSTPVPVRSPVATGTRIGNRALFGFVVGAAALTVVGFLASSSVGVPLHLVAASGGVLIIAGVAIFGASPRRVVGEIDVHVLVFFVGLFVIIEGTSSAGLLEELAPFFALDGQNALLGLALWSSVLSNVVSNVPAVILLAPTAAAAGSDSAWLLLAATSTLAGNATILGAAANVIVAETARAFGEEFSVLRFMRAGLPIAIVTLAIAYVMIAGFG